MQGVYELNTLRNFTKNPTGGLEQWGIRGCRVAFMLVGVGFLES